MHVVLATEGARECLAVVPESHSAREEIGRIIGDPWDVTASFGAADLYPGDFVDLSEPKIAELRQQRTALLTSIADINTGEIMGIIDRPGEYFSQLLPVLFEQHDERVATRDYGGFGGARSFATVDREGASERMGLLFTASYRADTTKPYRYSVESDLRGVLKDRTCKLVVQDGSARVLECSTTANGLKEYDVTDDLPRALTYVQALVTDILHARQSYTAADNQLSRRLLVGKLGW